MSMNNDSKLTNRAYLTATNENLNKLLPSQTNNGGKTLVSDGTNASWVRAVRAGTGSNNRVSVIGDSRTRDLYVNTNRKNGRSWIAWANAYMQQSMRFVANYAQSGKRSDEYLAEAAFAPLLADASNMVIFGYPAVNDIGQAFSGYTDTDGQSITLVNVVDKVLARIVDRVQRLVASGKTVIVCTEPGAISLAASQVACVHDLNTKIRSTFASMAGVSLFDPVELIWARSTTSSAIAFKTGYSTDGTHANASQGQFIGKYAADKFFPAILTQIKDYGVDLATSSAQLFPNAGYATLTGGTTGNMTGTDPVPANVVISATAASLASYTLTSTVAEDGTGNEITITVTASGAVSVRIAHQGISVAGMTYTDNFVGGVDVTTVSSSNCRVYWIMQVYTHQGTNDGYDLYAFDATDVWPPTGAVSEVRMQSDPTSAPSGATSGLAINGRLILDFKAAGSVVVKLKDPTVYRK